MKLPVAFATLSLGVLYTIAPTQAHVEFTSLRGTYEVIFAKEGIVIFKEDKESFAVSESTGPLACDEVDLSWEEFIVVLTKESDHGSQMIEIGLDGCEGENGIALGTLCIGAELGEVSSDKCTTVRWMLLD